jgi:putative DNA primase/helicase
MPSLPSLRRRWRRPPLQPNRSLAVLSGIESITVLVDHDAAGETAALECSARWTAAGAEVFRIVPRRPGADVNDLLMTEAL